MTSTIAMQTALAALLLLTSLPASAQLPVLEFYEPETMDYVFRAEGEHNIFPAPQEPRSFASMAELEEWVKVRVGATANSDGTLASNTRVEGIAVYQTSKGLREVTNPIAVLLFGEYGYITVAGERIEGFIDPGIPKSPEGMIPVVFQYLQKFGWARFCGTAPLGTNVVCGWVHSSSGDLGFAMYGGGTVVREYPVQTRLGLAVSFLDEFGAPEPIPPPGSTFSPFSPRRVTRAVTAGTLSWDRWTFVFRGQPLVRGHYTCSSGSVEGAAFGSLAVSRWPIYTFRTAPFCPR